MFNSTSLLANLFVVYFTCAGLVCAQNDSEPIPPPLEALSSTPSNSLQGPGALPFARLPENMNLVPEHLAAYVIQKARNNSDGFDALNSRLEELKSLVNGKPNDDEEMKLQRSRLQSALMLKEVIDDMLSSGGGDLSDLLEDSIRTHERIATSALGLVEKKKDRLSILTLIRDISRQREFVIRSRAQVGNVRILDLRAAQCDLLDAELALIRAQKASGSE